MACENYHAGENTAAGTGVISAQPRVTQSPVVTGVGLQIPPRTVVLAPPGARDDVAVYASDAGSFGAFCGDSNLCYSVRHESWMWEY